MSRYTSIMRVAGEGFDADPVTLPCETCGRSEYSCECGLEECDHVSATKHLHHGNIYCGKCGWIYRFGISGCRWVAPDYLPPRLEEILAVGQEPALAVDQMLVAPLAQP